MSQDRLGRPEIVKWWSRREFNPPMKFEENSKSYPQHLPPQHPHCERGIERVALTSSGVIPPHRFVGAAGQAYGAQSCLTSSVHKGRGTRVRRSGLLRVDLSQRLGRNLKIPARPHQPTFCHFAILAGTQMGTSDWSGHSEQSLESNHGQLVIFTALLHRFSRDPSTRF